MYALPIATYTDYWRSGKNRGLVMGGSLALAASVLIYAPADAFPQKNERTLPEWKRDSQSLSSAPRAGEEAALPGEPLFPVAMTYRLEEVEIPISTEYIESARLLPGASQVQEEGRAGVERQVIRTTTIGGKISDERLIHQFVLNAPKKRVVIRNTKPVEGSEVDLSQYTVRRTFEVEATAYTYTGDRTATGVWPREGLIAVDPQVIPLGTEVYVEGYGHAIAADTGGAIKGHIIDVFFPSLQRCLQWGRRPVTIHILEKS